MLTPTSIAEPLTGVVPAGPSARRSRTADVALLLAAFVATAGVAFAIGRLSASESATAAPGLTGFPRLRGDGAQVEPGAALFAADAAGAAETSSSPAAAALPAVDGATADGATADRAAVAALSDTTDATTVGKGMAAGPPAGDLPVIGGDGQPPQGELPAGFDGGPPGAMPGAAFGGFIGTISAIEDGVLTLATQAGESRSIATDASTYYVRQASIEAADLSPGDRVRIASQRRRPSLDRCRS